MGQSLNVPNSITLVRLLLSVVLFVLLDQTTQFVTAAVLFAVAAGTDAVDGYIARKYGLVTVLGRILDPFVDKVIVCGSFVFLVAKPDSGVSAWMTVIVIGREMLITALRSFLEQRGQDFSATFSGKLKMVLQCAAITVAILSMSPVFSSGSIGNWFLPMRTVLLWSAIAATIYSGGEYVVRAWQLRSNW